jgi:alpha-galactosidase
MTQRKMVLVGAGSASFTVGLVADLLTSGIEADWTIGLVDINEEALDIARTLTARMIEKRGVPVALEASTDRTDVLPGADVVVTTIAVGGRKAWEDDILVPRRHGLFQPVGDTTGAGGISRALRQIPPMLAIAEDVHRLCPNACFFNYANPMGAICRAVNKATPTRVVGLCHGVQGTLRYLCSLIDVPYGETSALYLGMNHLTWITHLTLHGENLWPRIDAKLPELPADENPFSWELYRSYGAFPAVLDRHVVEFFSERFARGEYYGKKLGVDEMDILGVIEGGNANFERMARLARGEEPLPEGLFDRVLGEHEALVAIVASILADRHEVFPMNVPNSTVDGIPRDFILEMPVMATRAGCLPVGLPPMSPAVLAWTTEALYGVELTVDAALAGDRDLVVQALLYDRCVPDLKSAQALADDLIAAQKPHLPQFA